MRIILFISKDLAGNLAFNELYREIGTSIKAVYFSTAVGKKDRKVPEQQLLEYFEAEHPFEAVFPHIQNSAFIDIDRIETRTGIPCREAPAMDDRFADELKAWGADLFISARFGKLFKGEFLTIPPMGILNLHSAILPQYRGILGTLHSLIDGLNRIGCTLHYIPDEGIDNGAILDIAYLDVNPQRSLFWHVWNLYPGGARGIVKAVRQLENGFAPHASAQNTEQSRYFSLPQLGHFVQLQDKGFDLINKKDYIAYYTTFVDPEAAAMVEATLSAAQTKHALP